MKFWVKIIVALLVVVVIGFAVWAFFFREKDEVVAFNRTTEMMEYKQSLGIDEKLTNLRKTDYYHDKVENKLTGDSIAIIEINKIRNKTLSESVVQRLDSNYNVIYEYYSYYSTNELVDEIISYYLPYTVNNRYNAKAASALIASIDKYNKSLKELALAVDEVLKCQREIKGENPAIEFDVLKGYYLSYSTKYRESLNCASNVIINLSNYTNIAVFDNNYKADTQSALYESFARQLRVTTSIDIELEIDYANDTYIIAKKILDYKAGTSIYNTEYTEYKFLLAFNELYLNNPDVFELIFTKKNSEKCLMADNKNMSDIREQVQKYVVTVLNIIGF